MRAHCHLTLNLLFNISVVFSSSRSHHCFFSWSHCVIKECPLYWILLHMSETLLRNFCHHITSYHIISHRSHSSYHIPSHYFMSRHITSHNILHDVQTSWRESARRRSLAAGCSNVTYGTHLEGPSTCHSHPFLPANPTSYSLSSPDPNPITSATFSLWYHPLLFLFITIPTPVPSPVTHILPLLHLYKPHFICKIYLTSYFYFFSREKKYLDHLIPKKQMDYVLPYLSYAGVNINLDFQIKLKAKLEIKLPLNPYSIY